MEERQPICTGAGVSWQGCLAGHDQSNKVSVYSVDYKEELGEDFLLPEDWDVLRRLESYLQPFHQTTKQLEGQKHLRRTQSNVHAHSSRNRAPCMLSRPQSPISRAAMGSADFSPFGSFSIIARHVLCGGSLHTPIALAW
jgi:hypothetical protein